MSATPDLLDVSFGPKAEYQKDDCIRGGCPRESTLEARYGTSGIRCCTTPECQQFAAEMARHVGQMSRPVAARYE